MFFHLIGTNAFFIDAENERLSVVGLLCRQNNENYTSPFGKILKIIAPKRAARQHDYFSSFKR